MAAVPRGRQMCGNAWGIDPSPGTCATPGRGRVRGPAGACSVDLGRRSF